MNYKLGLALSIVIGVLVATFPLYSDSLSGYLWSSRTNTKEDEEAYTIKGNVEEVNVNEMTITVNGVEIKVLGTWLTPNGTEIESQNLLALIKPGDRVTVVYEKRGRWGYKLLEITLEQTGEHFVKIS